MSNKRRSRALFVRADGGPMCFSLVPCSERKEIRELVEYGGGVLIQPEKNPDAIRLVPSSITVTYSTEAVFSANYIRACSSSDKLFPLRDFKIPTASAVTEQSDCNTRRLRSVRSRKEYTLGEEISIAKYVASKPGVRVHGNAVYKEMSVAGIVPGKHSWQSLKEHYLKKIYAFKHLYESPHALDILSKTLRREAARDPDNSPLLSAASDVLVEDSSSEQGSRKTRGPSGTALEDENTPTEVIPETGSSSHSSGTPLISERLHKNSRRATKLSVSAKIPDKILSESFSKSGMESPLPKKNDHNYGISTSGEGSSAVALRKRTLPTSRKVHCKKQEPSSSSASVCAGSRYGLRNTSKASKGKADVPNTTGREPVLNEQRELLSALGRHYNVTPQKQPTPQHRESGSRTANINSSVRKAVLNVDAPDTVGLEPIFSEQELRSAPRRRKKATLRKQPAARRSTKSNSQNTVNDTLACTTVSKDPSVSDAMEMQQTHGSLQLESSSAVQQEHSDSCLTMLTLPETSASSILGHTSPPNRCMRIWTSPRKQPNTAHQGEATGNSLSLQPCSKSNHNVSAVPNTKDNFLSPGLFRGSGSSAVTGLLVCRLQPSRQCVMRSSPRKRQSEAPQTNCSSCSSTRLSSESANDATPKTDPEDPLGHFHANRSLPPCAKSADRHKKGISLHSMQVPDSLSSSEHSCTDPLHKTNTLSPEQDKTRERHDNASQPNLSPSSMPSQETTSSGTTPSIRSSSGKCTRSRSLLQKPQHEFGLRASTAKSAHGRKKAQQCALTCRASSSPPLQDSEGGHSSSACHNAYIGKDHGPLLSTDAEVEDLDSADEALLTEALVQEAVFHSPSPTPGVEDDQHVGTKEEHRDDVSEAGSLLSTGSKASTVTISSSGHSADEDSAPESDQDDMSKAQKELTRFLGILREGKNTELHERCPERCGCPHSTQYIRIARAAVSLSAFLAYHGRPLPSERPGIENPEMALLLEVILRRLEGSDENEQNSSNST